MNHHNIIQINKENIERNLIKVEITPIKENNNIFNRNFNFVDYAQDVLSKSVELGLKQKMRGRKKQKPFEKNIENHNSIYNSYEAISKFKRQNHLPSLISVREENFKIVPKFSMNILYNKKKIKITAFYEEYPKAKFNELIIKKFTSREQSERLKSLFSSPTGTEKLMEGKPICHFSLLDLETSVEEMFEVISNLRIENRFAILSNKLRSDEILILADSKKIFPHLNHNLDFVIFSLEEKTFSEKFKIQKSVEIAILLTNQISASDTQPKSALNISNPEYFHYDIFTLQNGVDEYLGLNFRQTVIDNLKTENFLLSREIKSLKAEAAILKQETLRKEEHFSNKINEMQFDFSRIQSEFKHENDSQQEQIKTLNGKLYESNLEYTEQIKKEIIIQKAKLDYLEKKRRCSVDFIDGFIIESHLEETDCYSKDVIPTDLKIIESSNFAMENENVGNNNINNYISKTSYEQMLCIICLTNIRDCVLAQCSHAVYCEKCLNSISPLKQLKNKNEKSLMNGKTTIECPICKTANKKIMKLIYS